MKIEEALRAYLNKDIVVYGMGINQLDTNEVECELAEIGEGWIRVYCGKDDDEPRDESIINLDNVIRVRLRPLNKKGKKRAIFD